MRVLILIILICFVDQLIGQNGVNLFTNSVSTALNNSSIADPSAKAAGINPASLIFTEKLYFSVGVQRSFLINDINQGNADVSIKMKNKQALGLQLYYHGNKIFNEMKASLGYAVSLADQTSIGVRFHGIVVTSPENKKEFAGTFTLGGQTQLSPEFGVAIVTFNPVGFFRDNNSNDLTHTLQLGMSYAPADYIRLFLSGNLNDNHPLSVAGGIAYNINKKLYLYVSAQANPGVIGFGIGIPISKGSIIDLGGTQHLQLGFSPSATYTYNSPAK